MLAPMLKLIWWATIGLFCWTTTHRPSLVTTKPCRLRSKPSCTAAPSKPPAPRSLRAPAAFAENVCHGRNRHGPQAHSRAASSRASRRYPLDNRSLTPTSTFAPKTLAFSLQGRKLSFEEAWAVSPASAHNFRPAALIRSESGVRSKRSMTFLPSKIPLIQAPMAGAWRRRARLS